MSTTTELKANLKVSIKKHETNSEKFLLNIYKKIEFCSIV